MREILNAILLAESSFFSHENIWTCRRNAPKRNWHLAYHNFACKERIDCKTLGCDVNLIACVCIAWNASVSIKQSKNIRTSVSVHGTGGAQEAYNQTKAL